MGEIIKCNFNLFNEGRTYTGHHRKYILESAINTCYAPETREGLRLREQLGYLGHGRRELARKLRLSEVEPIKLPDGSTILTENIPSNVTVFFEVGKDGACEHHQEILETAPGKVVAALNGSRVGGFSWACGGTDGGSLGATRIRDFHGFDYVMNPGFSANRGYILENADGKTKDMILENICKQGMKEREAERYLKHWVASDQLRLLELEDQITAAAIYEDALREEIEQKELAATMLRENIDRDRLAQEARKKIVLECAQKSVIVIPERVVSAMLNMADERDFYELVSFFESAAKINLSGLPIPADQQPSKQAAHASRDGMPPAHDPYADEYGRASTGLDFESNGIALR